MSGRAELDTPRMNPDDQLTLREGSWPSGEGSAAKRGLLAALIVATLFALGFAQENSALVFLEEEPLELDPQATEGVEVVVCNVGQTPVSSVVAKPGGFGFPEGKGLIVDPEQTFDLARGDCQTLLLMPNAGLKTDTGEYKGLLIVSADGVSGITRQVLVGPKEAETKDISAAAKPIWINNKWLPIPREVVLPLELKKDESTGPLVLNAKKDEILGVLSGGYRDGHAQVVVDQEPPETGFKANEAGVVLLPVRVEGVDGVGTYSGALTADGAEFETEFFVSHALLWALIPMTLGLFAGWLSLLLLKSKWPTDRLKERCTNLEAHYEKAIKDFHKHADEIGMALESEQKKETDPRRQTSKTEIAKVVNELKKYAIDLKKVRGYQESFNLALAEYKTENAFVDPATEDYKRLVAPLDTAEDDIRRLSDPEGFRRPLEDLALALDGLAKYLSTEFRPERRPALCIAAAAPLTGKALRVGETKEISEKAKGYADLVAAWCKAAKRLRFYERWAQRLAGTLQNTPQNPTNSSWMQRLASWLKNSLQTPKAQNPDEQKLKDALETVAQAKNWLLDVEDAATLESLVKTESLRQAYNTIARLGNKYPIPAKDTGPEPDAQRDTAEVQPPRPDALRAQDLLLESSRYSIGAWAVKAPPMPDTPQHANTFAVRTGRPFQHAAHWLGLGLAGLIAVLTILLADLYPDAGEAFGTTKDYLAAFVATAGGAVAAQFLQGPLATFLNRLQARGG